MAWLTVDSRDFGAGVKEGIYWWVPCLGSLFWGCGDEIIYYFEVIFWFHWSSSSSGFFCKFSMVSISELMQAAFLRLLLDFFNWPVSFLLLFFWWVSSELTWGFFCGWIELGTSSSSSDNSRTRFVTFFCGRELRTSSLSSDDSRKNFWTCLRGQTRGLNSEIGARWLKLSSDDKWCCEFFWEECHYEGVYFQLVFQQLEIDYDGLQSRILSLMFLLNKIRVSE